MRVFFLYALLCLCSFGCKKGPFQRVNKYIGDYEFVSIFSYTNFLTYGDSAILDTVTGQFLPDEYSDTVTYSGKILKVDWNRVEIEYRSGDFIDCRIDQDGKIDYVYYTTNEGFLYNINGGFENKNTISFGEEIGGFFPSSMTVTGKKLK